MSMDYYTHSYPFHQPFQNITSQEPDILSAHNFPLLVTSVAAMPQPTRIMESKPRLGKLEVEILEREFRRNPKPLTQVKKNLAHEMNVDLPRINNWFQNRRAKRKQEKKMKDIEEDQKKDSSTNAAAPLQKVNSDDNRFDNENHTLTTVATNVADNSSSIMTNSNSKMSINLSTTSGSYQQSHCAPYPDTIKPEMGRTLKESIVQKCGSSDCTQSPTDGESITQFSDSLPYDLSTNYDHSALYTSPGDGVCQNPPSEYSTSSLRSYCTDINMPYHELSQYHSQQLQECNSDQSVSLKNGLGQSEMKFNPARYEDTSLLETGFKQSSLDMHVPTLGLPPTSSNISFRSRPPINLASRRKKVQQRPTALLSHASVGQPTTGPQTLSRLEGFLPIKSPLTSPVRRIVSAGGNRVVASGRIKKQGSELTQRSPVKLTGFESFENFDTVIDQNLHNCYNSYSLTGPSSLSSSTPLSPYYNTFSLTGPPSLGSSLAPSTPLSPIDFSTANSDRSQSITSPTELSTNYVFNQKFPGCFVSINEEIQGIPSSDTTQSYLPLSTPVHNNWTIEHDKNDNFWPSEASYEAPLYSATLDNFPFDSISIPYSSSVSQPVTPAFESPYSGNYNFEQQSPRCEIQTQCNFASQPSFDYPHSETYQSRVSLGTGNKQNKIFHFSHTTPADFSEK